MTAAGRDDFEAYAAAAIPALRRLALLMCRNWHDADDLVQAALARLCQHWDRAGAADNRDAYARTVLVREFTRGRRAAWARRVSVTDAPPEINAPPADLDGLLDLQAALAALAPRQRAVLVLRCHCDLDVAQAAAALGCSTGTVKSQTAKALAALRQMLVTAPAREADESPSALARRSGEVSGHA
jgi:RNA polymerase sigma-70 factor (sigma-E family)